MDNPQGMAGVKALQNAQEEETILGIQTYKVFWSVFFGIVFIIIFLMVYLVFTGGHKTVSDKKMIEGVALEVGQNDVVKFDFEEEKHGMRINLVSPDSVDLTISSEPINLSLKINEIKEVDLNNNGLFDLKIKLVSIVNGKATIAFQKIESESCKEDWKCSEWSVCSKGYQKRKCSDLNSCGSIFDKPSEKKDCIEIKFVEDNSAFEENINNNQSVNDSTANALNSSLSNTNNSSGIPTENKSLNKSVENKANTTVNPASSNNFTDRPSTNYTNYSNYPPVNYPSNTTANTTTGSSGETENHSSSTSNNSSSNNYNTTNPHTDGTIITPPCPSGAYFCNEFYGYTCPTIYILSPNSPSCCSHQCLMITNKEYLCYAKGYKFFTGNETHICKVQVYTYFNATTVPCCSVIEARYPINTNTTGNPGSGGTGSNTNSTGYNGLSN
jgi:hypothetical protein